MSYENKQQNQYLLNRIHMCRLKFEAEIKAAEYQLDSVNKRLTGLIHDFWIYVAFLAVPVILFGICDLFTSVPERTIIYIVFGIAQFIILFLYIITLPFNICNLTKTIFILCINRESDKPAELPPYQGMHKGAMQQEVSYRLEHDKLVLVLSRYYLYLDRLDQLYQEVKSASNNMTLGDLEFELKQLPVYERIQPANPFTGPMGEQVKRLTRMVMLCIVLAILLSLLIAIYM